jgi:hypothetical protein
VIRRDKPPHNAQVLQRWVGEWANAEGVPTARLQRSVSYMVLAAMLSTVRDGDGRPLFLLKGGVTMELRLDLRARATQDLDAAVRARSNEMVDRLRDALDAGHGDFTATTTKIRAVRDTGAIRATVKLAYRGRPWGTVPVELAPVEGGAGDEIEHVPARTLDPLGIDGPTDVPCLSARYQIAQKLHACTEFFDEGPTNARFRDLIDVLLLRELLTPDDLPQVRAACVETFDLRGKHTWPPTLTAPPEWEAAYASLAAEMTFPLVDVNDAADAVRRLVEEIDAAL